MFAIHDKIAALLQARGLKKRDIAIALGVAPQTATDICRGSSAITLRHLRNLVTFFELRPDYWLDGERLLPDANDRLAARGAHSALARSGLLQVNDLERTLHRVRTFLAENRAAFVARNPDLTEAERTALGLLEPKEGLVGRIADSGE